MTVNTHFNNYSATNEQDLLDTLVVESIQIKGLDVKYMPRTQDDMDWLYAEDPTSSFDSATVIEMYPAFVDGFEGAGEMMSSFGIEFNKSATFICSKSRWATEFPLLERPREGDLIYMPVTNSILEVRFVSPESEFFERGKNYVYEIKLEMFKFSYEDIETGDVDLDTILDNIDVVDPENVVEDFGDNDEMDIDIQPDIIFNPNNPFGVR